MQNKRPKKIKSCILGSLCLPGGSEVWQMCWTPFLLSHSPSPGLTAACCPSHLHRKHLLLLQARWIFFQPQHQADFVLSCFIYAVSLYPRKLNLLRKICSLTLKRLNKIILVFDCKVKVVSWLGQVR